MPPMPPLIIRLYGGLVGRGEKRLLVEEAQRYEEDRRRVPMLVPVLPVRSEASGHL